MPRIFTFRALSYNLKKVGGLNRVVTQPYDRIDKKLQRIYYKRHPYNIVRIIKGKNEPNKYIRAGETFCRWLAQEIFQRDAKPCLYAYYQTYRAGNETRVRKGLTALVRLEEPGKGSIHPHEETHCAPKVDRLELMRHTYAHFGHVFLLYSDPTYTVNQLLDRQSRKIPFLEAFDDFGEKHHAWRISNPHVIRQLQRLLARKDTIIADGHHRYETAWTFREEMRRKRIRMLNCNETPDNVLVTLINMDDEGLTIFPTHRLVYGLPRFSARDFLNDLQRFFHLREYAFHGATDEKHVRRELLEDLQIEGLALTYFGIAVHGISSYFLATPKDKSKLVEMPRENRSSEWKSLVVNLLHAVVLDKILGITKKKLMLEQNVEFLRSPDEALDKVHHQRRYQCAFLVNPVNIEQIRSLVECGKRFPQKATDFYPKLLTGFLMNKMEIERAR